MLFWFYAGKMQLKHPSHLKLNLGAMLSAILIFGLVINTHAQTATPKSVTVENKKIWARVEETIVPLRENTSRNGAVIGFASKGQVLVVEKATEHWVKVRANDTLAGWAPTTSFSASGPPVQGNMDKVKGILMVALGLTLFAFLFLALSLQRKRKAESEERSRQAMADAKRRLQNKIQVLFRREPRIHSQLAMDEIDLLEYLRGIGYAANLETDVEKFQLSCKTFKPHLVLAEAELQPKVEEIMETDALLINTPVIYLHSDSVPTTISNGVRAYLETPATDKELAETITLCLKKSPEKIRFSVQQTALKGGIHDSTLMELLHFLSAVKKTGALSVSSESIKGEIHLLLGNITRARTKLNSGEKAVKEILDCISGYFEFHEKEPVADGHAGINTEKILMDWARTRDENKHRSRP
jgi:Domain of unknown function (DUF4388)